MQLRLEPPRRHTLEEYLRSEQQSAQKHEYRDGQIVDMAGGSYEHGRIIFNLNGVLYARLLGTPCSGADSNLRVRIARKVLYTYPDVTIIRGPPRFDADDPARTTVLNPRVIVEVLSPSTGAYDRGEKFDRYLQIESLQEYVLVAQDRPAVQSFLRQPDARDGPAGPWLFTASAGLDAVARVHCLGIDLPLTGVYAGVEFPPAREGDADGAPLAPS